MMRRKLLFVLTTFVIMLSSSSHALAWEGTSLSSIAGDSQGNFYLYNVGKKLFLSQGGLWGTGTEVNESGLQMLALESAGSGKYYVKTNLKKEGATSPGYLNFADGWNITNDTGNFFLDQGKFSCGQWTIEQVAGKKNVYTLKVAITEGTEYTGKSFYLSAESSSASVVPTKTANDEYSQWMFVTLTEITTAFLSADDASVSNPTPSPFLFSDAGFYRSDLGITSWAINSARTALSTDKTNKPLSSDGTIVSSDKNITPSDAISSTGTVYNYSLTCEYYRNKYKYNTNSHIYTFSSTSPVKNLTTVGRSVTIKDNFIPCGITHEYGIASQVLTLKSTTTNQTGYTYYIGNGYILDESQGDNLDPDLNDKSKWQSLYGKDWTANIHGATGVISQQISSSVYGWTPGWYKVTCKGMSNDGNGFLFAYAGEQNQQNTDKFQTAKFVIPESVPSTYVKAARLINDGTSAFEQSVTVYVAEGETLTFGAAVQDGTASSWTCFDSFALSYCGKGEFNLIVDEEQTSLEYLNKQVETKKNQILRLKRDLKVGVWNSIVLPVTLNAGQVKTAFGNTSLAKLRGAKDNRIYFDLVNLDDNEAEAIAAGQLYIIKPQNAMPKEQAYKYHSQDVTEPAIDAYYTINQVAFTSALTDSKVKTGLIQGASTDEGLMNMVGTYVSIPKDENADNPIPAKSYVLSGGRWIYAVNGVNHVLGLRGWIEAGKANSTKNLIFNIDGVDEEEVSTGIDGIYVDGVQTNTSAPKTGIYSISGQKMSGTTSLPKGIYIVNGRKMIVK